MSCEQPATGRLVCTHPGREAAKRMVAECYVVAVALYTVHHFGLMIARWLHTGSRDLSLRPDQDRDSGLQEPFRAWRFLVMAVQLIAADAPHGARRICGRVYQYRQPSISVNEPYINTFAMCLYIGLAHPR